MRRLTALLCLGLASGCAPTSVDLRHKADMLAQPVNMRAVEVPAGGFTFLVYERVSDPSAPVRVYIEGDGNAWLSRSQVSPDPTPLDPVALKLAVRDNAPNVAYVGRACQYIKTSACTTRYWTLAQFSEEVIAAENQVVNRWQGRPIELVGYSGGGAVALLVAARRDDVKGIRTVAGNVDTAAFTKLHHVTPLSQSHNPADYMQRTAAIPQRHFSGSKDTVVPTVLISGYQQRLPAGHCSAYDTVAGVNHYAGWLEQWPQLLARPLPCVSSAAP